MFTTWMRMSPKGFDWGGNQPHQQASGPYPARMLAQNIAPNMIFSSRCPAAPLMQAGNAMYMKSKMAAGGGCNPSHLERCRHGTRQGTEARGGASGCYEIHGFGWGGRDDSPPG